MGSLSAVHSLKVIQEKALLPLEKTNVQNLTAEFDLRRKCQTLAFNTWEPQPASPWLGRVQSFLMKNKSMFNHVFPCSVGSEDQQVRWT